MGPVVFSGWNAAGEPVGMPWAEIRTPWVQLAAASEDQSRNMYGPLLEMIRQGPVMDAYGVEPMDSFVALPKGRIEFVTASAVSREGNRPVYVCMDQVESWTPTNGGVKLAATLRRNLGKTNGTSLEAPNAFVPGEGSVAEATASYAAAIREGRVKDDGLLYDHREAPADTDMSDRESLLKGLAYAYGDAADVNGGWVDLDRIVAEVWSPDTAPEDARRYYLNQVTHATDSWLSHPEWAGRVDVEKVIADRDVITLGFDGSRRRAGNAVADATALIGCRVEDGHIFEIGIWEQPAGPAGKDWQVPVVEVLAAIHQTFRRYNVVGFYADPAKWEGHIADLEARYSSGLKVKATRDHPIEWWMVGGRARQIVQALEQFHNAVVDGELTHDGSYTLTRHVLNARRRVSRSGSQIAKSHPDSANKIDGAVAAVLAWTARLDAVAAGVQTQQARPYKVKRIR